jgi:hypothetical protein
MKQPAAAKMQSGIAVDAAEVAGKRIVSRRCLSVIIVL